MIPFSLFPEIESFLKQQGCSLILMQPFQVYHSLTLAKMACKQANYPCKFFFDDRRLLAAVACALPCSIKLLLQSDSLKKSAPWVYSALGHASQ